jgi:hypothetical protein
LFEVHGVWRRKVVLAKTRDERMALTNELSEVDLLFECCAARDDYAAGALIELAGYRRGVYGRGIDGFLRDLGRIGLYSANSRARAILGNLIDGEE